MFGYILPYNIFPEECENRNIVPAQKPGSRHHNYNAPITINSIQRQDLDKGIFSYVTCEEGNYKKYPIIIFHDPFINHPGNKAEFVRNYILQEQYITPIFDLIIKSKYSVLYFLEKEIEKEDIETKNIIINILNVCYSRGLSYDQEFGNYMKDCVNAFKLGNINMRGIVKYIQNYISGKSMFLKSSKVFEESWENIFSIDNHPTRKFYQTINNKYKKYLFHEKINIESYVYQFIDLSTVLMSIVMFECLVSIGDNAAGDMTWFNSTNSITQFIALFKDSINTYSYSNNNSEISKIRRRRNDVNSPLTPKPLQKTVDLNTKRINPEKFMRLNKVVRTVHLRTLGINSVEEDNGKQLFNYSDMWECGVEMCRVCSILADFNTTEKPINIYETLITKCETTDFINHHNLTSTIQMVYSSIIINKINEIQKEWDNMNVIEEKIKKPFFDKMKRENLQDTIFWYRLIDDGKKNSFNNNKNSTWAKHIGPAIAYLSYLAEKKIYLCFPNEYRLLLNSLRGKSYSTKGRSASPLIIFFSQKIDQEIFPHPENEDIEHRVDSGNAYMYRYSATLQIPYQTKSFSRTYYHRYFSDIYFRVSLGEEDDNFAENQEFRPLFAFMTISSGLSTVDTILLTLLRFLKKNEYADNDIQDIYDYMSTVGAFRDIVGGDNIFGTKAPPRYTYVDDNKNTYESDTHPESLIVSEQRTLNSLLGYVQLVRGHQIKKISEIFDDSMSMYISTNQNIPVESKRLEEQSITVDWKVLYKNIYHHFLRIPQEQRIGDFPIGRVGGITENTITPENYISHYRYTPYTEQEKDDYIENGEGGWYSRHKKKDDLTLVNCIPTEINNDQIIIDGNIIMIHNNIPQENVDEDSVQEVDFSKF